MTEVKREHIGKNLIKESCGIVYRVLCTKCGRNLPWLEWECPYCKKEASEPQFLYWIVVIRVRGQMDAILYPDEIRRK